MRSAASIGSAARLLADDPWWLLLLKAVAVFVLLLLITLFNIVFERKVVARMQQRTGPNRAGPFGSLQSLADGIKLALKEDIVPKAADKIVFIIAPVLSTVPAFLAFAVIPLGPEVSIFGRHTVLQLADFPVAVLYVLAVASIGIYGIVLAGWSSGSTYPLLGALRSSAQLISYEVSMGLSFVAVFLYTGSMSTADIVAAQAHGGAATIFGLNLHMPSWYAIALAPSFIIYVISMVGETNRAPFDLPEAEGELVGGFHTEYSSLKFALFFLAEYINMTTVSALATTLFLGGWRAPFPISLWDGANRGWWPLLWFVSKVLLFIFVFIWLRGTLPRLRYDQFMKLGWKILIPVSLVWTLLVASLRTITTQYDFSTRQYLIVIAILVAVLLVASIAWDYLAAAKAAENEGVAVREQQAAVVRRNDAFSGGFPVPPMPAERWDTLTRTNVPTSSARATLTGEPVLTGVSATRLSSNGNDGDDADFEESTRG